MYEILVKSNSPRLSYSDIKIENLGTVSHHGFRGRWISITPCEKFKTSPFLFLSSHFLQLDRPMLKYLCFRSTLGLSSERSCCLLETGQLANWLIYARAFVAGLHPLAATHFGARLGAFFYWTGCFKNNVLFDNTAQIYLINLHWKLGLGFKLRLRVALF